MILDKNKTALAVGIFFAIMHAIWSVCVAIIPNPLQSFMNWATNLHAIEPFITINAFNFLNAAVLIVITFVFGCIFGWIYAWGHNVINHKK